MVSSFCGWRWSASRRSSSLPNKGLSPRCRLRIVSPCRWRDRWCAIWEQPAERASKSLSLIAGRCGELSSPIGRATSPVHQEPARSPPAAAWTAPTERDAERRRTIASAVAQSDRSSSPRGKGSPRGRSLPQSRVARAGAAPLHPALRFWLGLISARFPECGARAQFSVALDGGNRSLEALGDRWPILALFKKLGQESLFVGRPAAPK